MAESAASAKSTKLRSMSSEVSGKKGLKSSLEDVTCSIAGGWRADLPEFPFQYGTTCTCCHDEILAESHDYLSTIRGPSD